MSKKPLVEDYQQQTPYMAEAIVRVIALQDAEDVVLENISFQKQGPSCRESRRVRGDWTCPVFVERLGVGSV